MSPPACQAPSRGHGTAQAPEYSVFLSPHGHGTAECRRVWRRAARPMEGRERAPRAAEAGAGSLGEGDDRGHVHAARALFRRRAPWLQGRSRSREPRDEEGRRRPGFTAPAAIPADRRGRFGRSGAGRSAGRSVTRWLPRLGGGALPQPQGLVQRTRGSVRWSQIPLRPPPFCPRSPGRQLRSLHTGASLPS